MIGEQWRKMEVGGQQLRCDIKWIEWESKKSKWIRKETNEMWKDTEDKIAKSSSKTVVLKSWLSKRKSENQSDRKSELWCCCQCHTSWVMLSGEPVITELLAYHMVSASMEWLCYLCVWRIGEGMQLLARKGEPKQGGKENHWRAQLEARSYPC